MNTSSQFERDESVFDVFVFWWLILSLLFFVELFGATAISQGLPVPLWYIFIGLLVVFAIALIPALLHGMVVPRVNEELIVSTSALLSILVLFTQLYSVGHFYYLGPYLVVSTLVIIPFLVHWLLRPDNTTGFWIGLPFLFLASGLFLYRTLFDYWGIFSLRDPPLLSLIILFLVAAVVLTVLSMDRFRIRRFIQSHRSAVITSIAGIMFLTCVLFLVKNETPQWNLGKSFQGRLPQVSMQEVNSNSDDRPNVILISVDTLRFDSIDKESQFLKSLREDSIQFNEVISTSGWTLPSHASLFSSLLPYQHGAVHFKSKINSSTVLYPQLFKKLGYKTGAFTDGGYVSRVFGFSRGFDRYWEQTPSAYNEYVPGSIEITSWILSSTRFSLNQKTKFSKIRVPPRNYARNTLSRARKWLTTHASDDRPYFLFLHTYQVHDYKNQFPRSMEKLKQEYPRQYKAITNTEKRELYEMQDPTPLLVDSYKTLYRYEFERTMEELEEFINFLRQRGEYRNSLILFLSDHGEGFSLQPTVLGHTHGQISEILIRVPTWIKLPGSKFGGRIIDEMLSIRDLFPLICNYLSIQVGDSEPTAGYRDLKKLISNKSNGRKYTRGSAVYDGNSEKLLPKLFVRSDTAMMTHVLDRDVWVYHEMTNSPPYDRPRSIESPAGFTRFERRMRTYARDVTKSKAFLKDFSLSENTKEMLEGLGYL